MTAEQLNDMRDRNCPDWLCDPSSDLLLQKRVKELEIKLEKIVNFVETEITAYLPVSLRNCWNGLK